ncbi:MAG: Lrp/AsnC ligand binding domain-containing protein [Candidatus Thorarchaeota archaeon]
MIVVIILVQVEAKTVEAASKAIEEAEYVKNVHVVTGPYDIIAYAEIPSRSNFRRLVSDIHDAPGVVRTETCMSI